MADEMWTVQIGEMPDPGNPGVPPVPTTVYEGDEAGARDAYTEYRPRPMTRVIAMSCCARSARSSNCGDPAGGGLAPFRKRGKVFERVVEVLALEGREFDVPIVLRNA